jgi:phosphoglycolate phosphatase
LTGTEISTDLSPTMKLRFEPILFDLDGTLIDSSADLASAVNRTLSQFGLPALDPARIIGFVGDGARRLMERVLAQFPSADIDECIAAFQAHYRRGCLDETRPYPGIEELLSALRPARMAVATNKPASFARRILSGLGLADCFATVIGGDEAPLKPLPDQLYLALERMNAQTQGALMVGDHPNDIIAAKRAGIASCGVTWGFDGGEGVQKANPDFICRSPEELLSLIRPKKAG